MEFLRKKKDMSFLDDKAVALLNAEIILTQKCNLACPHCMRGCSTNKEITPEALDGFLSKVCHIDQLSLGGGEIPLVPNAINLLTEKLKQHNVGVMRVDFASNGLFVNDEVLDALNNLKTYVEECRQKTNGFFTPTTDKPDMPLYATFSFDDFHIREILKTNRTYDDIFNNILRYKSRFGLDAIECRIACDVDIINSGRAKDLKTLIKKTKPLKPSDYAYPYYERKDLCLFGGILTLSTDGLVIPPNIPFEDEKALSFGDAKTDKLSQIFANMKTYPAKDLTREYNKMINKLSASNRSWKKYYKAWGKEKINLFYGVVEHNDYQPEK
ncbi:MAG: radical SAM protein [Clostridia bacterium]|nr:radical SAM protein [Clostridia bacterium]